MGGRVRKQDRASTEADTDLARSSGAGLGWPFRLFLL